jgi:hypothetical protein
MDKWVLETMIILKLLQQKNKTVFTARPYRNIMTLHRLRRFCSSSSGNSPWRWKLLLSSSQRGYTRRLCANLAGTSYWVKTMSCHHATKVRVSDECGQSDDGQANLLPDGPGGGLLYPDRSLLFCILVHSSCQDDGIASWRKARTSLPETLLDIKPLCAAACPLAASGRLSWPGKCKVNLSLCSIN